MIYCKIIHTPLINSYTVLYDLQQFKKIQLEVDILRSLSHKNIVQYLGTSINETRVYIFMEYITGGSLQSILKRYQYIIGILMYIISTLLVYCC